MKIIDMLENKKKAKLRKERAKVVKKVTAGAAAGIAAGVLGGVLFAPKSGKETQADIAKTAKDLGENIKTKSAELKETVESKVTETKGNVVEAKEKISQYLADKKAAKKDCTCCADENVTEAAKEIEIPSEVQE